MSDDDSRVDLTVAELRLIRDHIPGLLLPDFLPPAATETAAAAASGQALDRLRAAGLVTAAATLAEPDWTDAVMPALRVPLALQMAGDFVFQVSAFTPAERTDHASTVTRGACSGLTVITPRLSATDAAARAVVALTPVDRLWTSLCELVPGELVPGAVANPAAEASAAPSPVPSVAIGLVESRALIAAMRAHDRSVIDALATELHVERPARQLLEDLSGSLDTGFRVKAFTATGCVYSHDWFLGPRGWITVRLSVSGAAADISATDVVDGGTVRLTRARREDIRVDLLGIVATLVRDTYAAR
ncbi:hypothetical protein D6T64_21570 [Cryobacterium melibiosiphilum]|uniref:ESX secretion-associated protein EspG n=1 Tax=Cryobacterium melibiosiphilum TaxID=995039 RepID=A0A3A5MDR0_9MICO|nr:hypothetical protein [Cryobacterium melibiosiphilum]RJT84737.1 hypothetical protein D6T64_21570 [Cryobacterium melibiosiphilum]